MKKIISLLCAFAMIACVTGCNEKANNSSDAANFDDAFMSFTNSKNEDGSSETTESGNNTQGGQTTSGGKVTTSKNEQGGITGTIDIPDEPTKTKSELTNKNYGGKSFTLMYWYQPDDVVNRKIAAFNKAHNAKVKLEVVNDDLADALAKAIASGKPYDIVANHGRYFPQSIFKNLYEPLEGYIAEEDMYNSANHDNWGLSKTVNDMFAWNGHYYALGSAKSVYSYVLYYNKKMFNAAGLEDPWELYKKGQWTWDKLVSMGKQVTEPGTTGFLYVDNLYVWDTFNAVSGIKYENGTFTEQLTDSRFVQAAQDYQNLYYGDSVIGILPSGNPFKSGKAYMTMEVTDAYSLHSKNAKVSSAFGRGTSNLGVVPVPYTSLNSENKYPGHAAQGYSSTKGAKDPSVAACYALFESRYTDSKAGSDSFPVDVRNETDKLFAKNGYLGFHGFRDSSGTSYTDIINAKIGTALQGNANVTATMNNNRSSLQRVISDTISQAK